VLPLIYLPCAVLCCAVSRFVCRSELYEFDLTIDINIDIYPLKVSGRPQNVHSSSSSSSSRSCSSSS
jgi:hypothetical protein